MIATEKVNEGYYGLSRTNYQQHQLHHKLLHTYKEGESRILKTWGTRLCRIFFFCELWFVQHCEPADIPLGKAIFLSSKTRLFFCTRVKLIQYYIGICCFSAKHGAFIGECQDWLARNASEVTYLFVYLCQWTSTINIKQNVMV